MIHLHMNQEVLGTAYCKLPHKIIGQLIDNPNETHVVINLNFAPHVMTERVRKHLDEYVAWFKSKGIRVEIFIKLREDKK